MTGAADRLHIKMARNPKVSIIVPAYNAGRFLLEALESAFAQTYQNTEIIVVNDGSTDDTEELLRPWYGRIIYLVQENKGLPSALNVGLQRARGDYIAILDADDIWERDKIAAQIALMEAYPDVGLSYTNFLPFGDPVAFRTGFDENNGALRRYCSTAVASDVYLITSSCLFRDLLVEQGFPKPSSTMIRKICFERVGTFNERLTFCQDTEMTLRMSKYFQFAYIDRCLLKRRIHAGSLASMQTQRYYALEHIEMFRTLDSFVSLTHEEKVQCRRVLASYHAAAGYIEFSERRMALSRRHFLSSLKLNPTAWTLAYFSASCLPGFAVEALRRLKN